MSDDMFTMYGKHYRELPTGEKKLVREVQFQRAESFLRQGLVVNYTGMPASLDHKFVYFGDGGQQFVLLDYSPGKKFEFGSIAMDPKKRFRSSVSISFGDGGEVSVITQSREEPEYPLKFWSEDIKGDVVTDATVDGTFVGAKEFVYPDFSRKVLDEQIFEPMFKKEGYSTFKFPDGMYVVYPTILPKEAQDFVIQIFLVKEGVVMEGTHVQKADGSDYQTSAVYLKGNLKN